MHLDHNISLRQYNTFGMDVYARHFVEPRTDREILTLMNYRQMVRMPILFLGGGSNILFLKDFPGLVVRINSKGIHAEPSGDGDVLVTVHAGENWDEFVLKCVENGWAGLENLSMIPGTAGAAPIQNIGAYGVEAGELIKKVHIVDINSNRQKWLSREECRFGYRDSIFRHELNGTVIIISVTFRLRSSGDYVPKLGYGELAGELKTMGIGNPTISEVRQAVCNIRSRKLPDPAELGNAGSFFRNPVIGVEQFEKLRTSYPGLPGHLVTAGPAVSGSSAGNIAQTDVSAELEASDDQNPSLVKVPAAWLIQQCGLKGFRQGDAGVHINQPLVLVNYGAATGPEILSLADMVRKSVNEKFGITLDFEVNII